LQQFTFNCGSGYGKSDTANANDHTKWGNDILSGWERDADFQQRKRKPVVSERQSDRRCYESAIRRDSVG